MGIISSSAKIGGYPLFFFALSGFLGVPKNLQCGKSL